MTTATAGSVTGKGEEGISCPFMPTGIGAEERMVAAGATIVPVDGDCRACAA